MNQSPLAWHKLCTVAMFAIEFGAPFTVIAPARLRRAGCAAMVTLQALIAGSGNYCFFNLLSASLCMLTLDDDVWPRCWRMLARLPAAKRDIAWPVALAAPASALNVLITTMLLASTVRMQISWPKPLSKLYEMVSPLRTFNGYGLFAVMTTERPEIIIEGSNDREHWLAYEFKWKPGDVTRRPRLVAPHQPRLDWQMWFAALGSVHEQWFQRFLVRLLEGSPEVLGLLGKNPFPDAPPHYVRALLYDYHFTRFSDDDPHAWWKRELKGIYFPEASLRAVPAPSPTDE
jgi:lipase maturation factor 1